MLYETFCFYIFYLAWRSFRCTSFNKKLVPALRFLLLASSQLQSMLVADFAVQEFITAFRSLGLGGWCGRGWNREIAGYQEAQLYIPIAYVSTIWDCGGGVEGGLWWRPLYQKPTHSLHFSPSIEVPADAAKAPAYNKFLSSTEQECLPSSAP